MAVSFPEGDPGQRVVATVEDGGTLRDGQRVFRGYTAEDFKDAFARYAA